jgi:uncharacterized membrane protein
MWVVGLRDPLNHRWHRYPRWLDHHCSIEPEASSGLGPSEASVEFVSGSAAAGPDDLSGTAKSPPGLRLVLPTLIPPVLHPLVVHFVVVLVPAAAVLATVLAFRPSPWGRNLLLIVLAVAAVAAFTADQLGDNDLHKAGRSLNATVREAAHTHENLGSYTWLGTAGIAIGTILFRNRIAFGPWPWVLAGLLWAVVAVLALAAWYGGALTYEYGVNTP